MKNLLNEYSSELIERINNGSNKFLFIFEKLQAAGTEVVIDKDEYQWMKEHIDEINITLNMLDEKPLQIQFNEKKEIEELSTSYNDTQTRSQSLNSKIILDSLNSQVFINNLNSLSNIKVYDHLFSEGDTTEESNYIQKISSENNSELKVGQDTISAISTPNNKNNIIFLSDSQEIYFNRLNKVYDHLFFGR